MSSHPDRLELFLRKYLSFVQERDWGQFHSPKNIAMGVASEAGELLQHFRFLTEDESYKLDPKILELVRDEIGDVFIFLIYLAHLLDIDPIAAANAKLNKNVAKYPVEIARGSKEKRPALQE